MNGRKWAAVALFGAWQAADAVAQQPAANNRPGYLVVRVLVEGGANDPADPNNGGPNGPAGENPNGGPPMPPAPGGNNRPSAAARSVVAVIPYTKMENKPFDPLVRIDPVRNPNWPTIKHKYGTSYVFADNTSIQFFGPYTFSLEGDWRARYQQWSQKREYDTGFDLLTTALQYGMVDEAFKVAGNLAKLPTDRKELPVPARVGEFIKAYNTLAAKIDAVPTKPDRGEEWRQKFVAAAVATTPHYALVHWGEQSVSAADLDRRLVLLEQNFRAFYLWHALQGIALPLPERRLVAVLASRSTDLPEMDKALDGLPIRSDAFYSPAHDLLVLSPERTDDSGSSFLRVAQGLYAQGWNRDELLRGKFPKSKTAPEIARSMTLALVDKYVEEEGDLAAITREGCRQLFVASGVLPSHVRLPRWVNSGTASLFQKPKGPAFTAGANGQQMTVGIAAGYGSPNYVLHRAFKDMAAKKQLHPDPMILLRNVITDTYFRAAAAGFDPDPPPAPAAGDAAPGGINNGGGVPQPPGPAGRGGGRGGPPAPPAPPPGGGGGGPQGATQDQSPEIAAREMKARIGQKAEATAWALTYYLARSRNSGLQKFHAELRAMPRDLELGDEVVLLAFCRSFNLMNGDRTAIDPVAFKQFAAGWLDTVKNAPPYGLDIPLDGATLDPNSGGTGQPNGSFGPGEGGGPQPGGRGVGGRG